MNEFESEEVGTLLDDPAGLAEGCASGGGAYWEAVGGPVDGIERHEVQFQVCQAVHRWEWDDDDGA